MKHTEWVCGAAGSASRLAGKVIGSSPLGLPVLLNAFVHTKAEELEIFCPATVSQSLSQFDDRSGVSENRDTSGPVAQLGARFHGMEEVVGSIPTRSTNKFLSCTHSASRRAGKVVGSIPTRIENNSGPVAQLGARFHGMEEVVGSIPTRSTKFLPSHAFCIHPAE